MYEYQSEKTFSFSVGLTPSLLLSIILLNLYTCNAILYEVHRQEEAHPDTDEEIMFDRRENQNEKHSQWPRNKPLQDGVRIGL